ncbi:hypothetical protein ACFL45_07985 [Candidatus Neomarinimicrobiota bacterium]
MSEDRLEVLRHGLGNYSPNALAPPLVYIRLLSGTQGLKDE